MEPARGTRSARRALINDGEESMANDRELIEPNEGDKRYVRRNDQGEFTESQDDVGRSLSQDQQRDAKTETKKGQGDRGDRHE
jgi:hypothetical protein